MDKLIKHFNDIEMSFKVMKYLTTLALAASSDAKVATFALLRLPQASRLS